MKYPQKQDKRWGVNAWLQTKQGLKEPVKNHEILLIFVKRGQDATPYLFFWAHTPISTHASALGLTEAFIQPSQASTPAEMKLSI